MNESNAADADEHEAVPLTGQAMRGFTIAAVAIFATRGLAPYAGSLPDETFNSLTVVLGVVSWYGIYLIASSPIVLEIVDRTVDAAKRAVKSA